MHSESNNQPQRPEHTPGQENTPTTSQQPAPQIDQARFEMYLQQQRGEQNLSMAVAAGLVVTIAAAVVWAAISALTQYQIGFMAIGVGFVTGYAIRVVGKGFDQIFGIAGAVLSLFGCVLGNLLTAVYWISTEFEAGYFYVLFGLDMSLVTDIMVETFSPMDVVFYAIAIYFGYKYSFRQFTEEELRPFIRQG